MKEIADNLNVLVKNGTVITTPTDVTLITDIADVIAEAVNDTDVVNVSTVAKPLQPEILAKKLSNSFVTSQPQIGIFL